MADPALILVASLGLFAALLSGLCLLEPFAAALLAWLDW